MKVTASRKPVPAFQPVTVTLTLESEAEIRGLFDLMALDITVPEAVRRSHCSGAEDAAAAFKAAVHPIRDALIEFVRR